MDTIEEFISKVEQELDGIPKGSLTAQSNYRNIPEWSSMHALIIIALAETEYDFSLTGEDLRSCQTVQQLYDLIKSRKS